jgi:hypothetical protein
MLEVGLSAIEHDHLPRADTAKNATRMIGRKAVHMHFVAMLAATLGHRIEAVADLDTLDGIDRHQRRCEIAIELAVDGLAPTGRHVPRPRH